MVVDFAKRLIFYLALCKKTDNNLWSLVEFVARVLDHFLLFVKETKMNQVVDPYFQMRVEFNNNGYITLDHLKKIEKQDIQTLRGSQDDTKLLRDQKDAGSLKVSPQNILLNITNYVSLLNKYELLNLAERVSGKRLFPVNIAHLKSDKETGTLRWHRDSYMHLGKQIGSAPPALKLAVYLTDVNKKNGVTGFIPRSKSLIIKNRYLDLVYTYLMWPFAHYPCLSAGQAVLFDGSVIHGRPRPKNANFREAIIFGLVSDPWLAASYTKQNEISKEMISRLGHDKYL
jgi:hypothetical protein